MDATRGLSKSTAVIIGVVVAVLMAVAGAASGAPGRGGPPGLTKHAEKNTASARASGEETEGEGETEELLDRAEQYAAVRTAPAPSVSAEAFRAARAQASAVVVGVSGIGQSRFPPRPASGAR